MTSDEPAWPTLVERDLWERVNARVRNNRGPHRRPPRTKPGVYVLAGLIRCSVCGRSMHGATMKGKAYYRCNRQRHDYAETGHPRSTAIREELILTALDTRLNQLTDAEHRASTLAAVIGAEANPEPDTPEVRAAKRAVRQLPVELDRVLAAVRAGMDPALAAVTTKQIQRELSAAHSALAAWNAAAGDTPRPPSPEELTAALDQAGNIAALLSAAERETRARLYQALDLDLHLDPVGDPPTLEARLQLCGGGGRI